MRLLFLVTMAGLALYGREVLHARSAAESSAIASGGRAHHLGDETVEGEDPTSLPWSCAGRDEDLYQVCSYMIIIEAVAAAVAGGMLIAQTVQGLCFSESQ